MAEPIQAQYREQMNTLAKTLDERLNPPPSARRVGFALFTFEFGKIEDGRVNYISNGAREDMIAAMREWLARAEGRMPDVSAGPQ